MLVPPVVVELAEGDVLLVTVDELVWDFTSAPKNVRNKKNWKKLKKLKKLKNLNFILKVLRERRSK